MKAITVYLMLSTLLILPGLSEAGSISNKTALIPEVRNLTLKQGSIKLPDVVTISVPDGFTGLETFEAVANKGGGKLRIDEDAFIKLNIQPGIVPESDEGYLLEITASGISLTANSNAGLFYGLQTLGGMLRNLDELPACTIKDFPALKMRGVYLNLRGLRPGQVPAFKNVMAFLAGLKYNTLILEFADNFPYEGVEFKRDFRLSKDNILELKKHAADLHLEIIPKLQCLSHVLWMAGYPNFDGILEDPKNKSWNAAWCPSNPEVQELISKIIDETVALLNPRYFHLGLDEVNYGPFRQCDKCSGTPPEKLFGDQVKKLEAAAARNHVIPMFYHDTFLPQSLSGDITDKARGELAVNGLSRDTAIQVWDYSAEPRTKRTEYFAERKLAVIGASYCENMLNVQTLAQLMAKTPGALGCILTYWHYVNGSMIAPQTDSKLANAATILAANYSWNPDGTALKDINFDPVYEYARRFNSAPEPFTGSEATAVPLNSAVNFEFGQEGAFPVFDHAGLDKLAKELAALPEQFQLLKNADAGYYGILLSGSENDGLETETTIPVNGKANRLAFLMTASRPMNMDLFARWDQVKLMPETGKLVIRYADTSAVEIPLRYNGNMIDWNAAFGGYGCRIVNRGNDRHRALYQLTVLDWLNPAPDKEIASVTFSSAVKEGISPVMLAISAEKGIVSGKTANTSLPVCRKSISEAAVTAPASRVDIVGVSNGKLTRKPTISQDGYNRPILVTESVIAQRSAITITIPPLLPGRDSGRIILDYAVPAHTGFKTLKIQYCYPDTKHLKQSGVYLGNHDYSKFVSKYRIITDNAPEWQEMEIPVSSMHKEANGIDIGEVTKLRISLWLGNHENVMLQLGTITGVDEAVRVQHPLRKSIAE